MHYQESAYAMGKERNIMKLAKILCCSISLFMGSLLIGCSGSGSAGGNINEVSVSLREVKKFEDATAAPGSAVSFKTTGSVTDGSNTLQVFATLTSLITQADKDGTKTREDYLSLTDSTGNMSISSLVNSHFSLSGEMTEIASDSGTTGTVISQSQLPSTAVVGASGSYRNLSLSDGTTKSTTWRLDSGASGDVLLTFSTVTKDQNGVQMSLEEDSYTIRQDGTVSTLTIMLRDTRTGVTMTLSGPRVSALSGRVTTTDGAGVSGITVTVTRDDGPPQQYSTGADGFYVVGGIDGSGLNIGASGPVGATFAPASQTLPAGADYAGVNFVINQSTSPSTTDVTSLGDTSATLNGTFTNPFGSATTVWFEYGTSSSYGNSTNPATYDVPSQAVSGSVMGLASFTVYHYRMVTKTQGVIFYGADRVFTTFMTPQILAAGLVSPCSLAIDAANVYWSESGAIKKTGKNGGSLTTLASGLNAPFDIAVDSTGVYWAEFYGGAIRKVGHNGGAVTTLATTLANVSAIALTDTSAVWPDPAIRMVGKNGGATIEVVSALLTQGGYKVAVDTDTVYWTEYGIGGKVRKAAFGSGTLTTLVSQEDYAGPIAVDSADVFWLGGGALKKIGKNGGVVTILATGPGYNLALDSTNVYWIAYTDGPSGGSAEVRKVGKNGGPVITLARIPNLSNNYGLAVDETNVYWTESTMAINGGMIKTLPKNYR